MSGKVDVMKLFRDEYKAGKKPALVEVGEGQYLAIEGSGAPGGSDFEEAIGALYGMAYTTKMGRKADGKGDYTIGKMETEYWGPDGGVCDPDDMDGWNWRMLIRTPFEVDGHPLSGVDLALARERLAARKKDEGADRVSLVTLTPGPCVQMLHVGPYEEEARTLAIMESFMEAGGWVPHGKHHEVYLSDPRRTAPEKLKTILRRPVRKAPPK